MIVGGALSLFFPSLGEAMSFLTVLSSDPAMGVVVTIRRASFVSPYPGLVAVSGSTGQTPLAPLERRVF